MSKGFYQVTDRHDSFRNYIYRQKWLGYGGDRREKGGPEKVIGVRNERRIHREKEMKKEESQSDDTKKVGRGWKGHIELSGQIARLTMIDR